MQNPALGIANGAIWCKLKPKTILEGTFKILAYASRREILFSQEGKSFFHKGKSCFQEGKYCFQGKAHLERKPQDYRRPRSGQDWPARNFPDLRFFAEVGREKSRSEASRRSGVGCAAGSLRGGRAADLPPGGFAEVGNASKAGPGGREST